MLLAHPAQTASTDAIPPRHHALLRTTALAVVSLSLAVSVISFTSSTAGAQFLGVNGDPGVNPGGGNGGAAGDASFTSGDGGAGSSGVATGSTGGGAAGGSGGGLGLSTPTAAAPRVAAEAVLAVAPLAAAAVAAAGA
jgi:hypothetical protein